MKYDCKNTMDFAHEAKRMCEYYINGGKGSCFNCPLYAADCDIDSINERTIDVIQKWSDEHPEDDLIRTYRFDFTLKNALVLIDLNKWDSTVGETYDKQIRYFERHGLSISKAQSEAFVIWLIDRKAEQAKLGMLEE